MIKHKLRAFASLPKAIRLARSHPGSPTFSHLPRKPRRVLIRNLIRWNAHVGSLHSDFFRFGLDREGRGEVTDYLPLDRVRAVRNSSNRLTKRETTSYSCLLADKFVFSQYGLSLGHAVARTIALCTKDYIEWIPSKDRVPLNAFWNDISDLDAFIKPVTGSQGHGVFPLVVSRGTVTVGHQVVDEDQLSGILSGTFLIQRRILQHPALEALNPATVNTIRLLTQVVDGRPVPVVAGLRIGHGASFLDNWNVGGMIVGINVATGTLKSLAYVKTSGAVTSHPTSGIRFEGLTLPFFREAVEAACRFHGDIPCIHSVGWDIAIAEEGPVIIEGNENWDPMLLVLFDPLSIHDYVRSAEDFKPEIGLYRADGHA